MRQKGFTLIELLTVITIMAILGTLSIAGFVSYNQVQSLQTSVNDVILMLNTAKSRAQSQVKPPSSSVCNGTLDGYKVEIVTTASTDIVNLRSRCGGIDSPDPPLMKKILPKNVKFSSSANYFFPVQKGGVDNTEGIILTIGDKTRTVFINSLGIIGFSQPVVPTLDTSVNSVTFSTVGTSTWEVPEGVTSVRIEVYGGGSGGHGGGNLDYPPHPNKGGAGGNNGISNVQESISVSSGQILSITVGSGGDGGSGGLVNSGSGLAGGQSSVMGGSISITALGGAQQSGYVATAGDLNGGSGTDGYGSGVHAFPGNNAVDDEGSTYYGGNAGLGYGAGGGGGASTQEQGNYGGDGGKGANGAVVITW
jgi:prepilin-type N-terminal cleavage/methylation domain-containing protein